MAAHTNRPPSRHKPPSTRQMMLVVHPTTPLKLNSEPTTPTSPDAPSPRLPPRPPPRPLLVSPLSPWAPPWREGMARAEEPSRPRLRAPPRATKPPPPRLVCRMSTFIVFTVAAVLALVPDFSAGMLVDLCCRYVSLLLRACCAVRGVWCVMCGA